MKKAIFWFRQDLRIYDNRGLIQAIDDSDELLPLFILDTNIIPDFLWLEDQKFLFLKEALVNLDKELQNIWLRLTIFHGEPKRVIEKLTSDIENYQVYANRSYSGYWKKRDDSIELFCMSKWWELILHSDYLMLEPEEVEQRKVFTPFYKLWKKKLVEKDIAPQKCVNSDTKQLIIAPDFLKQKNWIYNKSSMIRESVQDFLDEKMPWWKHPYFTMDFWKQRLEKFNYRVYDDYRNDLDKDGTSRLSVYLRFWIFSIRELYQHAKEKSESYISELAWREFWQHIDYYFPFTKEYAFQQKKRYIRWEHNEYNFQRWCEWKTGYPVVDAAMKQLVETNWMHWRARMIVASFLTKDLLIDWKWGEAFFKKHLLDYDENVNYWNWQWSASIWADPKPLRIFSPILQSTKFDPNATFIHKYIPELIGQDLKAIHDPLKYDLKYIPLVVDHSVAQRNAREVYKNSAIEYIKTQ